MTRKRNKNWPSVTAPPEQFGVWKDESWSHNALQARGSEPSQCWKIRYPEGVRLSVLNGHLDYPGQWIARIYPWDTTVNLESTNAAEAKIEAILNLQKRLDRLSAMNQETLGQ